MKRRSSFAVALFLPAMGMLFPCVPTASAETSRAAPETIILISLDTTRADRMSCYGYEHETTPNIDALAKDSLLFEHPFAPVPMTLPSHCSMFTGLIPPAHSVHVNSKSNLSASVLTLPEILQHHGYTTYGIASAMVIMADRGLGQGFDIYDDDFRGAHTMDINISHHSERKGNETTARALQWLSDNAAKKKFMFIHYFDPHHDYNPPAPFDSLFKDPYDGEIAFTDHCVGQIMDKLKALDLYDNALIALVGDHGEMLGEHGEDQHSFFIYQNVLRVPMMFKPPGGVESKRIKEPTSLIDVAPTVLSLAGLPVPDVMQGVDLSGYVRSDFTVSGRAIYSESMYPTGLNCSSLFGLVMGRWHYIQSPRPELYDRLKDPKETENLVAQYPERAEQMKQRLKRLLTESRHKEADASADLPPAAIEQLESLGYLDTNVVIDYSFDTDKKDAKDLIGVERLITEARAMSTTGKGHQAVKVCLKIIEQHPDVFEAYKGLVASYVGLGELAKTVEVLLQMRALFPEEWIVLRKLGEVYRLCGDYPKAIAALNECLAMKADDDETYIMLVDSCLKQKSLDKALSVLQRRQTVLPDNVQTLITMGNIYQALNDVPNAQVNFLGALKLDPDFNVARMATAKTYIRMGDLGQALFHYEQALARDTNLPEAHMAAARIKLMNENPQLYDPPSALMHARISFELVKEKSERKDDTPAVLELLAMAWAANGDFHQAIATAERAMQLYGLKGLTAQAGKIKQRIERYKEFAN